MEDETDSTAIPAGAHLLPLEVRLREVVGGWHVHYAEYLHYLEMAANDHLAALGLPRTTESVARYGGILIMRRLDITYLAPAFTGDRLEVATWVEEVRGARLLRRSQIRRADSGQVLVRARAEWVWTDEAHRPRRIPREMSERLATLAP